MTTGPRISIDFVTRAVTSPKEILAPVGGDLMVYVSFTGITAGVQGSIAPANVTSLSLALKEFDGGDIIASSDGWEVASFDPLTFVIHVPLTGTALDAALLDNAMATGSAVSLLGEIAWTMANPFSVNFGPSSITTRSLTFPITYSTAAYGTAALAGGTSGTTTLGSGSSTLAASTFGTSLVKAASASDALTLLGATTFGSSLIKASSAAAAEPILAAVQILTSTGNGWSTTYFKVPTASGYNYFPIAGSYHMVINSSGSHYVSMTIHASLIGTTWNGVVSETDNGTTTIFAQWSCAADTTDFGPSGDPIPITANLTPSGSQTINGASVSFYGGTLASISRGSVTTTVIGTF